jgi:hypothetical protein
LELAPEFHAATDAKTITAIAYNNGSRVSNTYTFTIAATRAAEECKTRLLLLPKN